jgi:hypothetical protein
VSNAIGTSHSEGYKFGRRMQPVSYTLQTQSDRLQLIFSRSRYPAPEPRKIGLLNCDDTIYSQMTVVTNTLVACTNSRLEALKAGVGAAASMTELACRHGPLVEWAERLAGDVLRTLREQESRDSLVGAAVLASPDSPARLYLATRSVGPLPRVASSPCATWATRKLKS